MISGVEIAVRDLARAERFHGRLLPEANGNLKAVHT